MRPETTVKSPRSSSKTSRYGVSSNSLPAFSGKKYAGCRPSGVQMQTMRRRGIALAFAGAKASRHGNAIATLADRRNVRRDDFMSKSGMKEPRHQNAKCRAETQGESPCLASRERERPEFFCTQNSGRSRSRLARNTLLAAGKPAILQFAVAGR